MIPMISPAACFIPFDDAEGTEMVVSKPATIGISDAVYDMISGSLELSDVVTCVWVS